MQFTVFDVSHGFCASLVADNGNLIMFDCGHSSTPLFRPSIYLRSQGYSTIHRLFITNYDQDHISDIENIWRYFHVQILHRNNSITATNLRRIKEESGLISPQMESLLAHITYSFTGGMPVFPPALPHISWNCFHVNYPLLVDTNNLSLVTVLRCKNTVFLIPGDIEKAGWQILQQDPAFVSCLPQIDVFIASHHGRENGFHATLFDDLGCRPKCFIFSDSAIRHATQEMTRTYARRASGIQFNGQTRYVLSTRNDGTLTWML